VVVSRKERDKTTTTRRRDISEGECRVVALSPFVAFKLSTELPFRSRTPSNQLGAAVRIAGRRFYGVVSLIRGEYRCCTVPTMQTASEIDGPLPGGCSTRERLEDAVSEIVAYIEQND
jgi:hypothetical protein